MEKVEETPELEEEEDQEDDQEEELELGLTLGAKTFSTSTPTSKPMMMMTTCRILTARDFRPGSGGGGPTTSSASSSSSSAAGSAANKRAKPGPNSPDRAAGPSQLPSQMAVGWPPVKKTWMNNLFNLSRDANEQNSTKLPNTVPGLGAEKHKEKEHVKEQEKKKLGNRTVLSPFVKVKMDGDPIGRKIDLNAINSYKSLASVLEIMFQKPGLGSCAVSKLKLLEESSEYKLTYEDKEGDWMLVGDVPWRMFVDTVKRLRIMRHCDDPALTAKNCSNMSKKLLR